VASAADVTERAELFFRGGVDERLLYRVDRRTADRARPAVRECEPELAAQIAQGERWGKTLMAGTGSCDLGLRARSR
jgi:hypothetical protein